MPAVNPGEVWMTDFGMSATPVMIADHLFNDVAWDHGIEWPKLTALAQNKCSRKSACLLPAQRRPKPATLEPTTTEQCRSRN